MLTLENLIKARKMMDQATLNDDGFHIYISEPVARFYWPDGKFPPFIQITEHLPLQSNSDAPRMASDGHPKERS
jgi:hypothetical protein